MVSKLAAICPLDGRYQRRTDGLAKILQREHLSSVDQEDWAVVQELSGIFSEHALIRNRVYFEADYFLALADAGLIDLSDEERKKVGDLNEVTDVDAQRIKDIEVKGVPGINNGEKTNHDVKAVEYFMRDKLASQGVPLEKLAMIHFGLTSEDIDNMAYNRMLSDAVKDVLQPAIKRLIAESKDNGVVDSRLIETLVEEAEYLEEFRLSGKFGGAIGNLSAHRAAYPNVDWRDFGKRWVESFGFVYNPMTTQIEPCDSISKLCQTLVGVNQIVYELAFDLNDKEADYIGDLLGISNALLEEFSRKQPVSRRQRDLSGSAVRRNYGTAMAFTLAAIEFCIDNQEDEADAPEEDDIDEDEIANLVITGATHATTVLDDLLSRMVDMADKYKNAVMPGKTHGQTAIPTTLGKEICVFAYRLYVERKELDVSFEDEIAVDMLRTLKRINTILVGFAQDVWQYISDEYILQKPVKGEIGSSTMAQKINPIDFENGEGNLLVSNALLDCFARRILTEPRTSAILENVGMPLGYSIVAYNSLIAGMGKIEGNGDLEKMSAEVDAHWEVLAEPIQTILRRKGVPDAYEAMKDLTRGKAITRDTIREFVQSRNLDPDTRDLILSLTPAKYIGDAVENTEKTVAEIRAYLQKPLDIRA